MSLALSPLGQQRRLVINIRRFEAVMLLAFAAYAVFAPQLPLFVGLPLVILAIFLQPRPRKLTSIREERRSQFVSALEDEAQLLRQRYEEVTALPLSMARGQMLWEIRREITAWIASADSQFHAFPEFKGIFEARPDDGGSIDELDSCMMRLRELRRLCTLSHKLKLPI